MAIMPQRRVVSTRNAGAPTVSGLPTFMRPTTTKPVAPKPVPPRPPVAGIQAMPTSPLAPAPVTPVGPPAIAPVMPLQTGLAVPVGAPATAPVVPADTGFAPVQAQAPISPLERYLQQLEERRRQMAGNAVRSGGEQLA